MVRLSTMLHRCWIFPCNKEKEWKVQIVSDACPFVKMYLINALLQSVSIRKIHFGTLLFYEQCGGRIWGLIEKRPFAGSVSVQP
jgi:hypothetical protein